MALTPKQLAIRRTGVTASDIRALVGLDPYGRTMHDVWTSKVIGEAPLPDNEARELGNELEPLVLRRGAAKSGVRILPREPESLTARHPEITHHIGTPDALLASPTSFGEEPTALAEAKVVGRWAMAGWEADEIPDWCLVQVAWQQHVWRLDVTHVFALLGTEIRCYRVERDEDLEGALIDSADRFWADHVLTRRPPEVDGSEGSRRMLSAVYPRDRGPILRAGPRAEDAAKAYFDAKRAEKAAQEAVELARQQLVSFAGEASGLDGDGWRLALKWVEPCEVKAFTRQGYRKFDCRPKSAKGSKAA